MEAYIKYQRFVRKLNGDKEIQKFLDEIVTDGWEIICYNETIIDFVTLNVTILGGKKQSNVL